MLILTALFQQQKKSARSTKEVYFSFKSDSRDWVIKKGHWAAELWAVDCLWSTPWCILPCLLGEPTLQPDHKPVCRRGCAWNILARFLFSRDREAGKKAPLTYFQDTGKHWISFQWDSELLTKIYSIIAHDPWPGLSSNKEKKRRSYLVSEGVYIRLLPLAS